MTPPKLRLRPPSNPSTREAKQRKDIAERADLLGVPTVGLRTYESFESVEVHGKKVKVRADGLSGEYIINRISGHPTPCSLPRIIEFADRDQRIINPGVIQLWDGLCNEQNERSKERFSDRDYPFKLFLDYLQKRNTTKDSQAAFTLFLIHARRWIEPLLANIVVGKEEFIKKFEQFFEALELANAEQALDDNYIEKLAVFLDDASRWLIFLKRIHEKRVASRDTRDNYENLRALYDGITAELSKAIPDPKAAKAPPSINNFNFFNILSSKPKFLGLLQQIIPAGESAPNNFAADIALVRSHLYQRGLADSKTVDSIRVVEFLRALSQRGFYDPENLAFLGPDFFTNRDLHIKLRQAVNRNKDKVAHALANEPRVYNLGELPSAAEGSTTGSASSANMGDTEAESEFEVEPISEAGASEAGGMPGLSISEVAENLHRITDAEKAQRKIEPLLSYMPPNTAARLALLTYAKTSVDTSSRELMDQYFGCGLDDSKSYYLALPEVTLSQLTRAISAEIDKIEQLLIVNGQTLFDTNAQDHFTSALRRCLLAHLDYYQAQLANISFALEKQRKFCVDHKINANDFDPFWSPFTRLLTEEQQIDFIEAYWSATIGKDKEWVRILYEEYKQDLIATKQFDKLPENTKNYINAQIANPCEAVLGTTLSDKRNRAKQILSFYRDETPEELAGGIGRKYSPKQLEKLEPWAKSSYLFTRLFPHRNLERAAVESAEIYLGDRELEVEPELVTAGPANGSIAPATSISSANAATAQYDPIAHFEDILSGETEGVDYKTVRSKFSHELPQLAGRPITTPKSVPEKTSERAVPAPLASQSDGSRQSKKGKAPVYGSEITAGAEAIPMAWGALEYAARLNDLLDHYNVTIKAALVDVLTAFQTGANIDSTLIEKINFINKYFEVLEFNYVRLTLRFLDREINRLSQQEKLTKEDVTIKDNLLSSRSRLLAAQQKYIAWINDFKGALNLGFSTKPASMPEGVVAWLRGVNAASDSHDEIPAHVTEWLKAQSRFEASPVDAIKWYECLSKRAIQNNDITDNDITAENKAFFDYFDSVLASGSVADTKDITEVLKLLFDLKYVALTNKIKLFNAAFAFIKSHAEDIAIEHVADLLNCLGKVTAAGYTAKGEEAVEFFNEARESLAQWIVPYLIRIFNGEQLAFASGIAAAAFDIFSEIGTEEETAPQFSLSNTVFSDEERLSVRQAAIRYLIPHVQDLTPSQVRNLWVAIRKVYSGGGDALVLQIPLIRYFCDRLRTSSSASERRECLTQLSALLQLYLVDLGAAINATSEEFGQVEKAFNALISAFRDITSDSDTIDLNQLLGKVIAHFASQNIPINEDIWVSRFSPPAGANRLFAKRSLQHSLSNPIDQQLTDEQLDRFIRDVVNLGVGESVKADDLALISQQLTRYQPMVEQISNRVNLMNSVVLLRVIALVKNKQWHDQVFERMMSLLQLQAKNFADVQFEELEAFAAALTENGEIFSAPEEFKLNKVLLDLIYQRCHQELIKQELIKKEERNETVIAAWRKILTQQIQHCITMANRRFSDESLSFSVIEKLYHSIHHAVKLYRPENLSTSATKDERLMASYQSYVATARVLLKDNNGNLIAGGDYLSFEKTFAEKRQQATGEVTKKVKDSLPAASSSQTAAPTAIRKASVAANTLSTREAVLAFGEQLQVKAINEHGNAEQHNALARLREVFVGGQYPADQQAYDALMAEAEKITGTTDAAKAWIADLAQRYVCGVHKTAFEEFYRSSNLFTNRASNTQSFDFKRMQFLGRAIPKIETSLNVRMGAVDKAIGHSAPHRFNQFCDWFKGVDISNMLVGVTPEDAVVRDYIELALSHGSKFDAARAELLLFIETAPWDDFLRKIEVIQALLKYVPDQELFRLLQLRLREAIEPPKFNFNLDFAYLIAVGASLAPEDTLRILVECKNRTMAVLHGIDPTSKATNKVQEIAKLKAQLEELELKITYRRLERGDIVVDQEELNGMRDQFRLINSLTKVVTIDGQKQKPSALIAMRDLVMNDVLSRKDRTSLSKESAEVMNSRITYLCDSLSLLTSLGDQSWVTAFGDALFPQQSNQGVDASITTPLLTRKPNIQVSFKQKKRLLAEVPLYNFYQLLDQAITADKRCQKQKIDSVAVKAWLRHFTKGRGDDERVVQMQFEDVGQLLKAFKKKFGVSAEGDLELLLINYYQWDLAINERYALEHLDQLSTIAPAISSPQETAAKNTAASLAALVAMYRDLKREAYPLYFVKSMEARLLGTIEALFGTKRVFYLKDDSGKVLDGKNGENEVDKLWYDFDSGKITAEKLSLAESILALPVANAQLKEMLSNIRLHLAYYYAVQGNSTKVNELLGDPLLLTEATKDQFGLYYNAEIRNLKTSAPEYLAYLLINSKIGPVREAVASIADMDVSGSSGRQSPEQSSPRVDTDIAKKLVDALNNSEVDVKAFTDQLAIRQPNNNQEIVTPNVLSELQAGLLMVRDGIASEKVSFDKWLALYDKFQKENQPTNAFALMMLFHWIVMGGADRLNGEQHKRLLAIFGAIELNQENLTVLVKAFEKLPESAGKDRLIAKVVNGIYHDESLKDQLPQKWIAASESIFTRLPIAIHDMKRFFSLNRHESGSLIQEINELFASPLAQDFVEELLGTTLALYTGEQTLDEAQCGHLRDFLNKAKVFEGETRLGNPPGLTWENYQIFKRMLDILQDVNISNQQQKFANILGLFEEKADAIATWPSRFRQYVRDLALTQLPSHAATVKVISGVYLEVDNSAADLLVERRALQFLVKGGDIPDAIRKQKLTPNQRDCISAVAAAMPTSPAGEIDVATVVRARHLHVMIASSKNKLAMIRALVRQFFDAEGRSEAYEIAHQALTELVETPEIKNLIRDALSETVTDRVSEPSNFVSEANTATPIKQVTNYSGYLSQKLDAMGKILGEDTVAVSKELSDGVERTIRSLVAPNSPESGSLLSAIINSNAQDKADIICAAIPVMIGVSKGHPDYQARAHRLLAQEQEGHKHRIDVIADYLFSLTDPAVLSDQFTKILAFIQSEQLGLAKKDQDNFAAILSIAAYQRFLTFDRAEQEGQVYLASINDWRIGTDTNATATLNEAGRVFLVNIARLSLQPKELHEYLKLVNSKFQSSSITVFNVDFGSDAKNKEMPIMLREAEVNGLQVLGFKGCINQVFEKCLCQQASATGVSGGINASCPRTVLPNYQKKAADNFVDAQNEIAGYFAEKYFAEKVVKRSAHNFEEIRGDFYKQLVDLISFIQAEMQIEHYSLDDVNKVEYFDKILLTPRKHPELEQLQQAFLLPEQSKEDTLIKDLEEQLGVGAPSTPTLINYFPGAYRNPNHNDRLKLLSFVILLLQFKQQIRASIGEQDNAPMIQLSQKDVSKVENQVKDSYSSSIFSSYEGSSFHKCWEKTVAILNGKSKEPAPQLEARVSH